MSRPDRRIGAVRLTRRVGPVQCLAGTGSRGLVRSAFLLRANDANGQRLGCDAGRGQVGIDQEWAGTGG